jgi:hypothetical protein
MAFSMQPLAQEEYTMKIVEDLGMLHTTAKDSAHKARYALFECTSCKEAFRVRCGSIEAKRQLVCQDCTLNKEQTYLHPLYAIWNGIRQRCNNPKRKDYHNYGGKGVTICAEWENSFNTFYTWCLNNGWNENLVIDKDIKSRELGIHPARYSPDTISFITNSQNTREAMGRQVDQLTKDGTYIKTYASALEAGLDHNLKSGDAITNTCRGRTKSSAGFKWKYTSNN